MAAALPKSRKGGASLKFMVRKPTTVVAEVIKTGMKFRRRLSMMASCLERPLRMDCNAVINMCILSATASVNIIVGAEKETEVSSTPAQEIAPMAPIIDRNSKITVLRVLDSAVSEDLKSPLRPFILPATANVIKIMVIMITKYIPGTRVPRSLNAASAKAFESMTTPDSRVSTSGYLASI